MDHTNRFASVLIMNFKGILVLSVIFFPHVIPAQLNSPYPDHKNIQEVIYYRSFNEPPKDLDPQTSYTSSDARYLSLTYESLLTYEYLTRPLKLAPGLAIAFPKENIIKDVKGKVIEVQYEFEIHQGVYFHDDICFKDGKGRELNAYDIEFALKRLVDPKTNCPVAASFSHLKGFIEFQKKLSDIRRDNENVPIVELYIKAGELAAIEVTGNYKFKLKLQNSYPQILYWLAMHFVCALPYEAVVYYNGKIAPGEDNRRPRFREHPVGTGPYYFDWDAYNRSSHIVLRKFMRWRGLLYPERQAPSTIFPLQPGAEIDIRNGIFKEEMAGMALPFIDRVDFYLERESVSYFNKFLQGYYDVAGIPRESFQKVIQSSELTPELQEKGITLIKDRGLDIYYLGFNMNDNRVGAPDEFSDKKLESRREFFLNRNRKLRQAMSLAIDSDEYIRVFNNGLGIAAQSPLPPGLFGYTENYHNKHRIYDPELKLARNLLDQAGYINGIDPVTQKPLEMTFDVPSAATDARVRYNFYIDAWRKLGLNVKLAATDYNKFQTKMTDGNYQIFTWGWLADYPDPENFLFLLYGPNSSKYGGRKPNMIFYLKKWKL